MFKRPVFITSSPNTKWSDVWLGLRLSLSPWLWRSKQLALELELKLSKYLGLSSNSKVYLTDSGRSALYFFLKAAGIGKGDEVIVPAFTCLAVANPVKWSGAKPVYVDANQQTFNMNLDLLEQQITDKTKAIVVQHTFGKPVDIDRVKKIIDGRDILLIEDCAHSLGGEWRGQKLGTLGDAAILAFGIDKVISGVRGGGVLVNFSGKLADRKAAFEDQYSRLRTHPLGLALKSLLNPLIWHIATPLYFVGIGKFTIGRLLIRLLFKVGIVGNVVDTAENIGDIPDWMPASISPVLAKLATHQLSRIDLMNDHRRKIAQVYCDELNLTLDHENEVYQKFSFLTDHRDQMYQAAKAKGFIIGNWLPRPLYAKFSSTEVYKDLSYVPEQNPVAEEIGRKIVNLPTSINVPESRALELARIVIKYLDKEFQTGN